MKNTMDSLAIVIPAYKADFLDTTLKSIAQQTNKQFTLYIGDDNSPDDLRSIIDKYQGKIKTVYHRFEENLGGSDLVKHWERCIDLTKNEEWIWLFSDDDIMSPTCVDDFYKEIDNVNHYDLVRFNVKVIDNTGNKLREIKYPQELSSKALYTEKIAGHLECFVVEYIFRRSTYLKYNGFVKFDLAWGSDLATWVNFGERNNILTLNSPGISWRSSGVNISTNYNPEILKRKVAALVNCLKWGEAKYPEKEVIAVNKRGLISRLSSIGVSSKFSIGYNGVYLYSRNIKDYILLTLNYCSYYCYKKLRNVFQRN